MSPFEGRLESTIASYRKILVRQDGEMHVTTCPAEALLGVDEAEVWQLTSSREKGEKLCVALDKGTRLGENVFWKTVCEEQNVWDVACKLRGDLVFFVPLHGLQWSPSKLRSEIASFVKCRYARAHPYHFSPFHKS